MKLGDDYSANESDMESMNSFSDIDNQVGDICSSDDGADKQSAD